MQTPEKSDSDKRTIERKTGKRPRDNDERDSSCFDSLFMVVRGGDVLVDILIKEVPTNFIMMKMKVFHFLDFYIFLTILGAFFSRIFSVVVIFLFLFGY